MNLEEGTDDDIETKILSLFVKGGRLGAAEYIIESGVMSVLPDQTLDTPHLVILESFLHQISPAHLVIPSNVGERELKIIKNHCQLNDDDGDELRDDSLAWKKNSFTSLHRLPNQEFSLTSCKCRVMNIKLLQDDNDDDNNEDEYTVKETYNDDQQRYLYINSLIDLSEECCVRASGALLNFMDKYSVENGSFSKDIVKIDTLSIKDTLYISNANLDALRIFNSEKRPSGTTSGSWNKSKEGLSLFGIFNKCRSSLGVKALRNVLRCPPRDIHTIQFRQEAVAFFGNHPDFVHNLQRCLGNIKYISAALKRIGNLTASVRDWKNMKKTIDNLLRLGSLCSSKNPDIAFMKRIIDLTAVDSLHSAAYFLEKIFDIQESEIKYRFVVKPGVNDELDELRRRHNGLPDLLTRIGQLEVNDLPDLITECTIVYLPRLGYMLTVSPWREDLTDLDYSKVDPNLEFLFQTGGIPHFKTDRCRELDRLFGDTDSEIREMEFSIVSKLAKFLLSLNESLVSLTNLAGQLDCLLAISITSKENGWTKPNVIPYGIMEIQGGRHPLQELCVETFVPNPTDIGLNRMCILTGPNACGKSVYLKQIGLIVYMAHLGSWVPASKAVIPITDRIETRIQTIESVSLGLSAFVIDLRQMTDALRSTTRNSLVLIDEFGKGTADVDGEALFAACMDSFLSRRDNCPYVFASTHFHGVQRYLKDSVHVKFLTFQYSAEGDDDGGLVYLYKVMDGICRYSYGHTVAQMAGVPKEVVERALEIAECVRNERAPSINPRFRCNDELYEVIGEKILNLNVEKLKEIDFEILEQAISSVL